MFGFTLLAALAFIFVLAPLSLRQRKDSTTEKPQSMAAAHSRSWYEQRLTELSEEDLEAAHKAELSEELAAVLLAEYPDADASDEVSGGSKNTAETGTDLRVNPVVLLTTVGVCLIVLAAGIYAQLGSFNASKIQGAQDVLTLSPDQDAEALAGWQVKLSQWLVDEPDDAQSWYLLGHAHLKLAEFDQAERAFAQAHRNAGNDISVKFYWLQARYLQGQGVLDEQSRQLADEILVLDPNSPQVLEMLAVAAISEGDAGSAITLLNRTLNTEQSPDRVRATVEAIAALRSAYQQQEGNSVLKVNVNVADGVRVEQNAVVFVVARPIGGGMPYAAVRRPSWLLPFSVGLDDLVSMSPARPLSQADGFEVLVRLSASGLAQGEAGDWEWLSKPLDISDLRASENELSATLKPSE